MPLKVSNHEISPDGAAVSVSPNLLTEVLNRDGSLANMEPVVWLYPEKNEAHLYRSSTSEPGMYSLEKYTLTPMKRLGKDDRKYAAPPLVPDGGFQYRVSGITFSTMVELNDYYLDDLLAKLKPSLGKEDSK